MFGKGGKWSSPGGFAKAYYYKQSDITWNTNKSSLHFHGKDGVILNNLLIKSCKSFDVTSNQSNVSSLTLPKNQSNIDNSNHYKEENAFKGTSSAADVIEVENDKQMPVKSSDKSSRCAALDEVGVAEVCSCPCSRIINADLEGIKLDMTILESQLLEAIFERDTESKIASLQIKQKDMEAVFHHQDELICRLNEDNLFFKSKISCLEMLISETIPKYSSNHALFRLFQLTE